MYIYTQQSSPLIAPCSHLCRLIYLLKQKTIRRHLYVIDQILWLMVCERILLKKEFVCLAIHLQVCRGFLNSYTFIFDTSFVYTDSVCVYIYAVHKTPVGVLKSVTRSARVCDTYIIYMSCKYAIYTCSCLYVFDFPRV